MHFATQAVHAGTEPDPTTGAIMTPIYQTSTYVQEAPGVHKGYEYARTQNPTRTALESALAQLEGGQWGLAFASGMAATDTLMKLLKPGDEVISTNDLYGGTYRLFTKVYEAYGIKFHFVNLEDAEAARPLFNANTRMIWLETPTNPLLRVLDIEALCRMAREHGALSVVDNTFASPALQRPLALGADIVVHSTTKYMGGHSDVVGGAVITSHEESYLKLKFLQNSCGAVPGPHDCFLTLRGLKTLHIRMERHCQNAAKVAAFLQQHPKVGRVYYPGFAHHANHAIAAKQMSGFGGMVSFVLKNDTVEAANKVLENTVLFSLAESLGGVESLIGHPATMTHASIPAAERHAAGLSDALIRLSVGIEDADDLIADLDAALQHA